MKVHLVQGMIAVLSAYEMAIRGAEKRRGAKKVANAWSKANCDAVLDRTIAANEEAAIVLAVAGIIKPTEKLRKKLPKGKRETLSIGV